MRAVACRLSCPFLRLSKITGLSLSVNKEGFKAHWKHMREVLTEEELVDMEIEHRRQR
jgi:hypothetical protein